MMDSENGDGRGLLYGTVDGERESCLGVSWRWSGWRGIVDDVERTKGLFVRAAEEVGR